MHALSLRQPWAAAVLLLGKTIENRVWNTTFRGRFLIHAAKAMTKQEHRDAVDFCEDVLGVARSFEIEQALDPRTLQFGGLVGMATLVGVAHPRSPLLPIGSQYPEVVHASGAWRWHMQEKYGFLLEDVEPLETFIPYRGELGFFPVDSSLMLGSLAQVTRG